MKNLESKQISKMKNYKNLMLVVLLSVVMTLALSACGEGLTSRYYIPGSSSPAAGSSNTGKSGGTTSGATSGSTSSTNAPTTSNGALDSCAIVKKEDFAPLVGGEVTVEPGRGDCTYYSVGLIPTVLLVATDRGDAEDFKIQKQVYGGLGGAFAGATDGPFAGAGDVVGISDKISDVPGLGDESFWTGGILITRKGNVIIILSLPAAGVEGKSKFDALKEITQKAVSRL